MQHSGTCTTTMEIDKNEGKLTPPTSRGRHNHKLKVLVRSHAMRESTSPPREPSPNFLISPCINVIPSSEPSPTIINSSSVSSPLVALSPSISRVTSPSRTPICVSPTSTLVPSPNARSSPLSASPHHQVIENHEETDDDGGGVYLNRLNKQNLERDSKKDDASHVNLKKKYICDCSNQNCIKCTKEEEGNINNNLTNVNNNVVGTSNTLTVNRGGSKGKLKQQGSSQGSFEGSSSNSPCLSRDSSCEQQYTDTSGIDLEQFIADTVNRSQKDRNLLLRIEQDLVNFAKDINKTHYKFPPMSSYQRMLVHRVAAFFGMEHNIEATGKCVVVNKTKNTRIPEIPFRAHIKDDGFFSDEPKRSILKRDSNSAEDCFKLIDRQFNMENRRSKSFEEREEEYERARRRIFNREKLSLLRQMHDGSSNDDLEWAELPWSSTDSENSSRFRLQLPEHNRRHMSKLIKVLSEETGETLRPCVAKSYSFGGYGVGLSRGDSVVSTHSAGPRLLTKQDSGASSVSWRLSPSSSGYKSQSQMSESVTPSPTSTPHPIGESTRQDSNGSDSSQHEKASSDSIVWAVTDIQSVPKGSVIINPQTGEPIKNDDGSLYYYDPNNPPPGLIAASKPPPSPKKSLSSPQRSVKDRSQSPKKRSKYSPSRKSHVTNSSTSPSLPYSPPLPPVQQPNRNFQFISGLGENMPQSQFPVYGQGFPPPAHDSVPLYQQPCFVYANPYGVPVSQHFENRMEQPLPPEMSAAYYMSIPENGAPPASQAMAYQQPPAYWNQQPLAYYQNTSSNPTPPQRFSLPMHPQGQPGYVPAPYHQNFLAPANQPPPPPNPDLLPVYPQQQMQVVYSAQPNQSNPVMYPNQPNLVYTQNPVYTNSIYPPANMPQYPQNTSTPNSCTSSASHATFTGHIQDQNHQNVMQLTQNMAQMSFVQNQVPTQSNFVNRPVPSHYDIRQKSYTPKGNKFNGPKPFILNSSQSSTGTNSPAATVVAGYGPPHPNMYRTPPETPPHQFGYGHNFTVPPMFFRQMSNVRATTPGTNRSSRSPTPASEVAHFDKQRIQLPTAVYHGTPYVLQSEGRISGRGQPSAYRHPPPPRQQSFAPTPENRSHKNRKSKGNKMSGPPPNGNPV